MIQNSNCWLWPLFFTTLVHHLALVPKLVVFPDSRKTLSLLPIVTFELGESEKVLVLWLLLLAFIMFTSCYIMFSSSCSLSLRSNQLLDRTKTVSFLNPWHPGSRARIQRRSWTKKVSPKFPQRKKLLHFKLIVKWIGFVKSSGLHFEIQALGFKLCGSRHNEAWKKGVEPIL